MTTNIELLKRCDDAYFNGEESELSDLEYDRLKRQEFKNDPSNSYFTKIGSDVRTGKRKLPYTMGSLTQIEDGEFINWVTKYSLQNKELVISDKLDGTSIMLVYNDGKFSIAYSRGNGIEGADVTRHVKHISNVPKTLQNSLEYLVVRAECIMPKNLFKKYSSEFKNPRNMVAGIMNRKESDVEVLQDIRIIGYEIVDIRGAIFETKEEMLQLLFNMGFETVHYKTFNANDLHDGYLSEYLVNVKENSIFELDGIVLTVNDFKNLQTKTTADSLNPEHSVKYKVIAKESIVETIVTDVIWEVSKSGWLKPRVQVVPVELFGTTVTYASGYNAKFIIDNGIGIGAKVLITKAGEVIPEIVTTLIPTEPLLPDENVFGKWQLNESNVEIELVDKTNKLIIFKQVLDFFETYKIDQLREATLRMVWNALNMKSYDDAIMTICDLSRIEWNNIVGANGDKIYDSLNGRMHNSKPETFLGASKYMGVGFGVRKAKALLSQVSIERLETLSMDEVIQIDGFDTITATRVMEGLPPTLELMNQMIDASMLSFKISKTTSELSTVNIVMTGFRDAELQENIEIRGGKVSSGVSKKTTHLLCLDPSSNSGKMKKARDFGVKIMTPEEFKIEFGL